MEFVSNLISFKFNLLIMTSLGKNSRNLKPFAIAALLALPTVFLLLPGVQHAFSESRAPNGIGTTLAFDDGKVVTVQYSQIYFCNSPGPATSPTNSPCKVGINAVKDPVPDTASNTLNVLTPSFLGLGGITPSSPSNSILGLPGSNSIFDPLLGANNFAQCPNTSSDLSCPNHPDFLDLAPALGSSSPVVVPLPIHSHVISGHGTTSAQGGWWELKVWQVHDQSIWPNPSTGKCSAGTGCLTSMAALTSASSSQVTGPIDTTIYLFFNVVSSSVK
jgi:hypothetical protein